MKNDNGLNAHPAKVLLVILDGWGIADDYSVSAMDQANIPFYRSLLQQYPNSRLSASEEAVGLPKGQMGNSEVGHTNIGAGRVVPQELIRIAGAIKSGSLEKQATFQEFIHYIVQNKKPLHLIGLVSDGGVHSGIEHLFGLLDLFSKYALPKIFIHAFTDGRDTDPRSGITFINQLEDKCKECGVGEVATIIGRYYAMDRNKRWERTEKAYKLLTNGEGKLFSSAEDAIQNSYAENITDEFIEPCVINPAGIIREGDAVLNFNFRTDRGRQLSEALSQNPVEGTDMKPIKDLYYVTMTRYDESYRNVPVFFDKENLTQTLGEVLAQAGKRQIRIAETEKYPHVTYFFNGGREQPFENEKRILCPSPKVLTYDLKPEMSAYEIKNKIVPEIQDGWADFICLNFANPDMVGHTGNFNAAVKACEAVDECLKDVVTSALSHHYTCIIVADHGNADKMRNADGSPHTAHTLAKVPFILVTPQISETIQLREGVLGDLAPTILHLMDLPIPSLMTGQVLVKEKEVSVEAVS